MINRLRDPVTFRLERLLVRGMHVRLLVITAMVGGASILGGLFASAFDPSLEEPGTAIWWAFLRLTDPGYLGDDQGLVRRTVSTLLTVLGYVLFMGSLVAIMTQWLNETMRKLEAGLTPIAGNDHVLVIGWTTRTATIVAEMLNKGSRVRRFLALHDRKRLHLVLMLEELNAAVRQDLRDRVGRAWRESQVTMRSGSPLYIDHLHRVDFLHSSAILLPSDDMGPEEEVSDARTLKTLLSIARNSRELPEDELPVVVTEIFDARKLALARRAYKGPLEVVASDQLIGRILSLTLLHPGLSRVFGEMLAYGNGSELHVCDEAALVGSTFAELSLRFPDGVVLGAARRKKGGGFRPELCPDPQAKLGAGDRLIILARDHEGALPAPAMEAVPPAERARLSQRPPRAELRVLILGWNDRVPDVIAQLAEHHANVCVDVLSTLPSADREAKLADHELGQAKVENHEGDVTSPPLIRRHLAGGYDRVLLTASDWVGSGAQSDARTILTYLLCVDACQGDNSPQLTVELMDGANRDLITRPDVEVLVSPLIIGRVLAHVTLRRELRVIYDDMFDAAGPVLGLTPASSYGLQGEHSFAALAAAVSQDRHVLMGLFEGDRLRLNPPKDERFSIEPHTQLVIIS